VHLTMQSKKNKNLKAANTAVFADSTV